MKRRPGSLIHRPLAWASFAALLLDFVARGQTKCSLEYTQPGTFICYPHPAGNTETESIPNIFHLSAQANLSRGRSIRHYQVQVDGVRVYDKQLTIPVKRLSLEVNVTAPLKTGSHSLALLVDGAGSASVQDLRFHSSTDIGFCDQFSRVNARTCLVSRGNEPLNWFPLLSNGIAGTRKSTKDVIAGYASYLSLWSKNLKAIEADTADAVAVDKQQFLYTASHSGSNIEFRKYANDGSLVYDKIIEFAAGGFTAVVALAIEDNGRAWIAGNTTTFISPTPNAFETQRVAPDPPHGFAILVDTKKPVSAAPIYAAYLSPVTHTISDLRVNAEGNVYISGATLSMEFQHESVLSVGMGGIRSSGSQIAFVAMLKPSGSRMEWSALLPGVTINSLATGASGSVYITGKTASTRPGILRDDVLVATIAGNGRELSYVARYGANRTAEGRAISVAADGRWVFVAGVSEPPELSSHRARTTMPAQTLIPFALAFQPCLPGIMQSSLPVAGSPEPPDVAVGPALNAFAAGVRELPYVANRSSTQNMPLTLVREESYCLTGRL